MAGKTDFKGKSFLSLKDLESEEVKFILDVAEKIKKEGEGEFKDALLGKTIGLLFFKASTRTRVSFEVAINRLNGRSIFLSIDALQLKRGEPLEDTARVFGRYLDGLVIRTFAQKDLQKMAEFGKIPVINALTDSFHPCQALADLLTVKEQKGGFQGLKLAYVGDGNNVAHSLLLGAAHVGLNIEVATPVSFEPEEEVVEKAKQIAKKNGSSVEVGHNPYQAVSDADFIYTDVWVSMGEEGKKEEIREIFLPFQVNPTLLSLAKKDVGVMHCLPAHRGEEITEEVIEGEHSLVWDEAENRLYTAEAVLALFI